MTAAAKTGVSDKFRSHAAKPWRHAGTLFADYLTSRDWKFAWITLAIMIALQFTTVYVMVWNNSWQNDFYNIVEAKRISAFPAQVAIFALILASQVGSTMISSLIQRLFSARWRRHMTERYLGRWFAADRFYEIERLRLIDNPDQRISDDVQMVTGSALGLALTILQNVVSAVSFSLVLLKTSTPIRFSLFGFQVALPGDMIWYGAAYAVVGSLVILWIGRPFIRRNVEQQHREGHFRANLIDVRRNAEQIGLLDGARARLNGLREDFVRVQRNLLKLILTNLGLNFGTDAFSRVSNLLPVFLLAPRYFAGRITIGDVMAGRSAFGQVVGSFSFFVQMYPAIAIQIANLSRLRALDAALDATYPRGIRVVAGPLPAAIAIETSALRLDRPNGAPLVRMPARWSVGRGERWVVQGPSGAGKSTLLRAISGLWPDGAGTVSLVDEGVVMFVPQRLYLPVGSLKAAACFPDAAETHADDTVLDLLQRVGLGAHAGELHERRYWQNELSPGEQQRLALVRILLHRPDVLVLDEATSAIDPDGARLFFETITGELPHMTLVSVVHDDDLVRYHSHRLTIHGNGDATTETLGGDRGDLA